MALQTHLLCVMIPNSSPSLKCPSCESPGLASFLSFFGILELVVLPSIFTLFCSSQILCTSKNPILANSLWLFICLNTDKDTAFFVGGEGDSYGTPEWNSKVMELQGFIWNSKVSFLINRITEVKVMQTTTSSELPASGFRNRYLKAKNKPFSQGRHGLTRLAHSSSWQQKSMITPLLNKPEREKYTTGVIAHSFASTPFFSLELLL